MPTDRYCSMAAKTLKTNFPWSPSIHPGAVNWRVIIQQRGTRPARSGEEWGDTVHQYSSTERLDRSTCKRRRVCCTHCSVSLLRSLKGAQCPLFVTLQAYLHFVNDSPCGLIASKPLRMYRKGRGSLCPCRLEMKAGALEALRPHPHFTARERCCMACGEARASCVHPRFADARSLKRSINCGCAHGCVKCS